MKTWLNKNGLYTSDKPKEYFVGKDSQGNDVFIGDICYHKVSERKRSFKVLEGDYFSSVYYLSKYAIKKLF